MIRHCFLVKKMRQEERRVKEDLAIFDETPTELHLTRIDQSKK